MYMDIDWMRFNRIHESVVLNWNTISTNTDITDNLKDNKLCDYFRNHDLNTSDSMIQAKVFSILLFFYF